MSASAPLRVRSARGQAVLATMTPSSTMAELHAAVAAQTGIAADALVLKAGFPPAVLKAEPSAVLSALGLRGGDIVIAESAGAAVAKPADIVPSGGGHGLVRRTIADDNSCLFNSIGYLMHNKARAMAPQLRQLVAERIAADPVAYTDAVLGKSNHEYCQWILNPNSWGGGLELAVFAAHYRCELLTIDVQTLRIDRFGEGAGYDKCAFLIYNGIHFDALARAKSPTMPEADDETVFPLADQGLVDRLMADALDVAKKAQASHGYTDLAKFDVQCAICLVGLKGQREVQQHALQTGHMSFKEFS